MTPLEAAKEKLTIPELAHLRGWDWKPGKSCRCPFRPDRQESGSVFGDGRLFKDFASGETFDAPALLAEVERLETAVACRLFIELAGVRPGNARSVEREYKRLYQERTKEPIEIPRDKPALPPLAVPTIPELRRLADVRGLGMDGLRVAVEAGFLWVTRLNGLACWALTDSARWVCQLRRLDGLPFPRRDGPGYKAQTCKGSCAAWPLGIIEAAHFPKIALVEGGPDFLAACHFIAVEGVGAHVAPVALLGAGQRIPAAALPRFHGKRVRIFAHADVPDDSGTRKGFAAATRWEAQLRDAGAVVTTFDLSGLRQFDGSPVKDLNDVARIHPDDCDAEPELSALVTF